MMKILEKMFFEQKRSIEITEVEKSLAGLKYDFWDEEVDARKLNAVNKCKKLNAIPLENTKEREEAIRDIFVSVGENAAVLPNFNCDD